MANIYLYATASEYYDSQSGVGKDIVYDGVTYTYGEGSSDNTYTLWDAESTTLKTTVESAEDGGTVVIGSNATVSDQIWCDTSVNIAGLVDVSGTPLYSITYVGEGMTVDWVAMFFAYNGATLSVKDLTLDGDNLCRMFRATGSTDVEPGTGASLVIDNVNFVDGYIDGSGGAITMVDNPGNLTLTNSTFTNCVNNNQWVRADAIYIADTAGSVLISDSSFVGTSSSFINVNTATGYTGSGNVFEVNMTDLIEGNVSIAGDMFGSLDLAIEYGTVTGSVNLTSGHVIDGDLYFTLDHTDVASSLFVVNNAAGSRVNGSVEITITKASFAELNAMGNYVGEAQDLYVSGDFTVSLSDTVEATVWAIIGVRGGTVGGSAALSMINAKVSTGDSESAVYLVQNQGVVEGSGTVLVSGSTVHTGTFVLLSGSNAVLDGAATFTIEGSYVGDIHQLSGVSGGSTGELSLAVTNSTIDLVEGNTHVALVAGGTVNGNALLQIHDSKVYDSDTRDYQETSIQALSGSGSLVNGDLTMDFKNLEMTSDYNYFRDVVDAEGNTTSELTTRNYRIIGMESGRVTGDLIMNLADTIDTKGSIRAYAGGFVEGSIIANITGATVGSGIFVMNHFSWDEGGEIGGDVDVNVGGTAATIISGNIEGLSSGTAGNVYYTVADTTVQVYNLAAIGGGTARGNVYMTISNSDVTGSVAAVRIDSATILGGEVTLVIENSQLKAGNTVLGYGGSNEFTGKVSVAVTDNSYVEGDIWGVYTAATINAGESDPVAVSLTIADSEYATNGSLRWIFGVHGGAVVNGNVEIGIERSNFYGNIHSVQNGFVTGDVGISITDSVILGTIYAIGNNEFDKTITGALTVDISGSSVQSGIILDGATATALNGDYTINLTDSTISGSIVGKTDFVSGSASLVAVAGESTISTIEDFDALTVSDGAVLKISGSLNQVAQITIENGGELDVARDFVLSGSFDNQGILRIDLNGGTFELETAFTIASGVADYGYAKVTNYVLTGVTQTGRYAAFTSVDGTNLQATFKLESSSTYYFSLGNFIATDYQGKYGNGISIYGGSDIDGVDAPSTATASKVVLTDFTGSNNQAYGGSWFQRNGTATLDQEAGVAISGSALVNHVVGGSRVQSGAQATITAGTSVEISGGTVAMIVVGGNMLNDKAGSDSVLTDSGVHTTTISGGVIDGIVIGGNYIQASSALSAGQLTQTGSSEVIVTGGTFQGSIYGATSYSSSSASKGTTIVGDVSIMIDASSNSIFFGAASSDGTSGSIFAGGHGYSSIEGNTTVTFKGLGSNLTFNGYLSGASSYLKRSQIDSAVSGTSTLAFESFTGELNADTIMMFEELSIDSNSYVVLTGENIDFSTIATWNLSQYAADASVTTLDWTPDSGQTETNFTWNDFSGDTLNLTMSDAADSWTVIEFTTYEHQMNGIESAASVNLNGEAAAWNGTAWVSDGYSLAVDESSNSLVMTRGTLA